MLSSVSACPMASLVLSLVILSVILDSYIIIKYKHYPGNNIVVMLGLLILIVGYIFLVWLANKSCYDYKWISWIVLIYMVYSIIGSFAVIIMPEKFEKELKEIDELLNKKPNNSPEQ